MNLNNDIELFQLQKEFFLWHVIQTRPKWATYQKRDLIQKGQKHQNDDVSYSNFFLRGYL